MRRFATPALVLAAVAALTSCAGDSGSSAPTTSVVATVTAAPTTSTSTVPTTTAVPACRASDLRVALSRTGAATGHLGWWFAFTNLGDTCRVSGAPALEGRGDDGTWRPVVVATTTDGFIPAPGPIGPLARGARAEVLVQGSNAGFYPDGRCPTAPTVPPRYHALGFTLPGDPVRLEVTVELADLCGLSISPFGAPTT